MKSLQCVTKGKSNGNKRRRNFQASHDVYKYVHGFGRNLTIKHAQQFFFFKTRKIIGE